jgi:hypothetical protein
MFRGFSLQHGLAQDEETGVRGGAARGGGGLGTMKRANPGARYQISIDGIPRAYRNQKDIAVAIAQILKARNPYSIIKLKDLQTGKETIVAFKAGE